MSAATSLSPSPKPPGCRWRLTLPDAVRLRAVAADAGLDPGEWCARAIHTALSRAVETPVPPPWIVPRPAENNIRSIMEPMSRSLSKCNPEAGAQVREMLQVWDAYREGKLVQMT